MFLQEHNLKTFATLNHNIKAKDPDPNDIKSWENFAVKQNLDLIAIKRAQDVAIANLKYERSKHFPTLDIYGTIKETDKDGGSSGAFESNNDFIGIELNIPIFIGGNTYYSSKQAEFQKEKARYDLLKKEKSLETVDKLFKFKISHKQSKCLKKSLRVKRVISRV